MWGNLGAAIAPPAASLVLGTMPGLTQWAWLFVACSAAFLISSAGAFLMDASRPLHGTATAD
jgi:hypothetical protein